MVMIKRIHLVNKKLLSRMFKMYLYKEEEKIVIDLKKVNKFIKT